jgi:Flp pilus assembly protein TadG
MTDRRRQRFQPRDRARGQSLVEFAVGATIFLVLLMAVIDGGRAVYQLNGVSEAAREIARVTSVHPGTVLGTSSETTAVITVQSRLVPALTVQSYSCVDIAGATVTGTCHAGNWVRVSVTSQFTPITPVLSLLGTMNLTSAASAKIE